MIFVTKRTGAWFLVLALLALPLFALASHADVQDENDTNGLLDVKFVKVRGDERPRWEFITFGEWSNERIWDRGYALVHFDAKGDRRFEKYALVRSTGFSVEGTLWRDRKEKSDVKIADLDVFRRNRRSVTVRIPLRKLDIPERRDFYRWFTETLFTGNVCPRVCIDRVPDERSIRESVAEPTPTPTVTPTPTPTVTPTPTGTP